MRLRGSQQRLILNQVAPQRHSDLIPRLGKTSHMTQNQSAQHRVRMLIKVPEITVLFWIIKLLTTGMGETTSDYLMHQMNPIFAVALGGGGLAVALLTQFSVRRYIPWVYWLAVIMVAIFGTMAADAIHVALKIPYLVSTAGFSIALSLIFVVWYRSEKTLSIHRIYTFRRELFYWATVMATFALGTAAGDMTASTLGLGYFTSGLLFAVLFALPAIAYGRFGLNEVSAFWFALYPDQATRRFVCRLVRKTAISWRGWHWHRTDKPYLSYFNLWTCSLSHML